MAIERAKVESAVITSAEVREMLGGIAHSTISHWVKDGTLPKPGRIGGRMMWKREEFMRWFDAQF